MTVLYVFVSSQTYAKSSEPSTLVEPVKSAEPARLNKIVKGKFLAAKLILLYDNALTVRRLFVNVFENACYCCEK